MDKWLMQCMLLWTLQLHQNSAYSRLLPGNGSSSPIPNNIKVWTLSYYIFVVDFPMHPKGSTDVCNKCSYLYLRKVSAWTELSQGRQKNSVLEGGLNVTGKRLFPKPEWSLRDENQITGWQFPLILSLSHTGAEAQTFLCEHAEPEICIVL